MSTSITSAAMARGPSWPSAAAMPSVVDTERWTETKKSIGDKPAPIPACTLIPWKLPWSSNSADPPPTSSSPPEMVALLLQPLNASMPPRTTVSCAVRLIEVTKPVSNCAAP